MEFPEEFVKKLEDSLPDVLKTLLEVMNDEKADAVSKVRAASIYRRLISEANKKNHDK